MRIKFLVLPLCFLTSFVLAQSGDHTSRKKSSLSKTSRVKISPIVSTYNCEGLKDNCPTASNLDETGYAKSYNAAAYACIDWSIGSTLWDGQQKAYKTRKEEDVIFAVGTLGKKSDLGKCYELTLDTSLPHVTGKKIIAQALDTGGDVRDGQYDLQVMAGGVGLCNAVTNTANQDNKRAPMAPLYSGNLIPWGSDYGGFNDRSGCENLPLHPCVVSDPTCKALALNLHLSSSATLNEKTTPQLCVAAYDAGVRLDSGEHPQVKRIRRIACPKELYEITGLRKNDDDDFTNPECFIAASLPDESGCEKLPLPTGSNGISRMFDGCKPSAAWKANIEDADPAYPVAIPCGPDGVTRVDMHAARPMPKPPVTSCYWVDEPSGNYGFCSEDPRNHCQQSKENCESCAPCVWLEAESFKIRKKNK